MKFLALPIMAFALSCVISCAKEPKPVDPQLTPFLANPYATGISFSSANYYLDQETGRPLTPNKADTIPTDRKILMQVIIGNSTKQGEARDFGDKTLVNLTHEPNASRTALFFTGEYNYRPSVIIRYHYHALDETTDSNVYQNVKTFVSSTFTSQRPN